METMELGTPQAHGGVLIVDDDAGVRGVLKRWIGAMGLPVTTACTADEALALMQGWAFDVAICDVLMPGHDGLWLVDQLRRRFPHTSIVLATGVTALDPRVTLRDGVVGYIVKPFNQQHLAELIQRALLDCRDRARGTAAAARLAGPSLARGAAAPRMLTERNVIDGVMIEQSEPAGSPSRS